MFPKILKNNFSFRVTSFVLSLFLLLSSCFPGMDWPYNSEKINMPLVEVLNELYAEENITNWRQDEGIKNLSRDYALVINIITKNYYKPVILEDLQNSSTKAIRAKWQEGERSSVALYEEGLAKLFTPLKDKYSLYMDAKTYSKFLDSSQNKIRGVGIYIRKNDKGLEILSFIKGSVLSDMKIPTGAIITAVDDVDIANISMKSAQKLILGKVGTKVKLTFFEPTSSKKYSRTVTRKLILVESITSEVITVKENKILQISIQNFNSRSADQFKKTLVKHFIKTKKPPIGLLINIRNNPGGLVNEVISMVDWLLDEGMILRIEYKNDEVVYNTKLKDIISKKIPIVILTNHFSASASEIFAGTLQNSKRATIFGTTSYGKTVVQRTYSLSEGRGFKTTIGRYFVFGDAYLEKGVEPNFKVEDEQAKEGDEIQQAGLDHLIKEYAILKNAESKN